MDKIKLREYRLRIVSRLFMIGGKPSEDMYLVKKQIREAMQGKPVEFVYEGYISNVKPYQAKLWIEQAPSEGLYAGVGYKNYLEPSSRNGFSVTASFASACRAFEKEFGYYPEQILLVRV